MIITDTNIPLVIFYGQKGSGKTLAIVSLVRYLAHNGYSIIFDRCFRNGPAYYELMEKYEQYINGFDIPCANMSDDFLLMKLFKNGCPIMQILDCPGFDLNNNPYDCLHGVLCTFPNKIIKILTVDCNFSNNLDEKLICEDRLKNFIMECWTDEVIVLNTKINNFNNLDLKTITKIAYHDFRHNFPTLFSLLKVKTKCSFLPYGSVKIFSEKNIYMYSELFSKQLWKKLKPNRLWKKFFEID